jgi:FecR protein
MEKRLTQWQVVLCVILVTFAHSATAAIGSITEQINNPPSIQRDKQTLTGAKGTSVEMNDAIRTQQGKVGITFDDNTKVQVTENSKLVIDDFVYDAKKGSGKLALNMALGTVRYASGAIAHSNPNSVAINTPSATIGVRGTDFTATVDELGQSTVILLPSCPDKKNRSSQDVLTDCKTGTIVVESDAGQVILNQPFQATRVMNRSMSPTKPVILKLNESDINNMIIISPPRELTNKEDKTNTKLEMKSALDIDFLKEQGLVNALDEQQKEVFQDRLARNFLDQSFLANILDILDAQMKAQLNLLNTTSNRLLPDYVALSGITVDVQDPQVTLCRDDGSNRQCVTTRTTQNSTIYQTQGSLDFKNRVNSGAGTTITLIQK